MNSSQIEIDSLNVKSMSTLKYYQLSSIVPPHEGYLHKTKARMLQLNKYHKIGQEYILPIPYLCQVYHLLNLKHLEQVHNFSLNGLKVVNVSQFEETTSGGSVRFKTSLNRSLNVLRMWRQPIVEAELVLHTPYTIELAVPVYNNCKIIILFNILPLGDNAHKLFIDIYSDLEVPKPILQLVFHCAACLTLVEDLPYLSRLANANLHRRVKSIGVSNRDTMKLFKRYVDLYGSSLERSDAIGAIELCPLPAATVAC
jgi:hypothetical protein